MSSGTPHSTFGTAHNRAVAPNFDITPGTLRRSKLCLCCTHRHEAVDVSDVSVRASEEVARLGFEPRLKESESFVLPLHYQALFCHKILFGFRGPAKPESPENGPFFPALWKRIGRGSTITVSARFAFRTELHMVYHVRSW